MIGSAVRSFLEEVPALEPMKIVVGVDLHARGDTQQFRIEMPGVKVTRDIGTDARIRLDMRRDFFNAMVENDAKVADWREAFTYGQAKATGVEQYMRLIEQVVEKAEERQRTRKARSH
jgi:pyruvate-formate lyase